MTLQKKINLIDEEFLSQILYATTGQIFFALIRIDLRR